MEKLNENIVNAIAQLVEEKRDKDINIVEINGKKYTNSPLSEIKDKKKYVSKLTFKTLTGLIDMIKNEVDEFDNLPLFVTINDYNSVSVLSNYDEDYERQNPFSASTERLDFRFNYYYDFEEFVIKLRSQFVMNDDLLFLLETLKTLTNTSQCEIVDDGVSQTVKTAQGASLAQTVPVSPIRRLSPFRTFVEVEQPASDFLFRLNKDRNFTLIEADGGAWKTTAMNNIKEYLVKSLDELIKSNKVVVVG